MFVSLTRVCVVYVVKELPHFGGLGQLQTMVPAGRKLLVETETAVLGAIHS